MKKGLTPKHTHTNQRQLHLSTAHCHVVPFKYKLLRIAVKRTIVIRNYDTHFEALAHTHTRNDP